MKKILGILGSPRLHGNTHTLLLNILESATQVGATTDIIILKDLEIRECDGCHTCWKGKDCSKCDDMNNLYSKIIQNDTLIFGTPVYWYGPTALIKAFIDRFVYFNCPANRKKIRGKNAVLVIPFEEENLETVEPLITMFEKSLEYLEMVLIEKIIVPGVGAKGDVLKKKDIIKTCHDIGKKLAIK